MHPGFSLLILLAVSTQAMAGNCGGEAIPIARVQGTGDASPLVGRSVTVEGIVTLDTRGDDGFQGFYLQQADAQTDDNPTTSEALFVFTRKSAGRTGHRVRVSGQVREFHGLTELVKVTRLQDCGGAPFPEPRPVKLPWSDGVRPEHLENMRIEFTHPLTVIDNHNLGRFGELTLAPRDQIIPTQHFPPGPAAIALQQQQQRARITLDDRSGLQHPDPTPYPTPALAMDNPVRAGDRVSNLNGILDYRFDAWRVQPLSTPEFQTHNARSDAPPRPTESTLRIASVNLENYFNGNGRGGGFPTPRGAENERQLHRQTARLAAMLSDLDADIVAVMEIENDGDDSDSAIANLAHALGASWRFVKTGPRPGRDVIRTGLLFHSDRVIPTGEPRLLTSGRFQRSGRPPLAQTFRLAGRDKAIRLVAVHFKSKSCRGAAGADADQGDGQGCYGAARIDEAQTVLQWLGQMPDKAALVGNLIAGDLNSYARETPLARFEAAGFDNLVDLHQGPDSYSYRYRGRAGTLDYMLADAALTRHVINASVWHVNADEPRALGYQAWRETTPASTPWRSSDHDPVIVDLAL